MCSQTSPRISFSHDLGQTDVVPFEHSQSRADLSLLLDSDSDFEFSINGSFDQESCSADELFSDGKILPTQIRERIISAPKHTKKCTAPALSSLPPLPCPSTSEKSKKETLKDVTVSSLQTEEKPQSKSFWGFKRSSSLNCDIGRKRSLICSLPILSRSNSTGSAPNQKKDFQKHKSNKLPAISLSKSSSSSSSSSSTFNAYPLSQKPPLKKHYGGSYGNGVWISPVLNVPPPYISKGTADLFGLGSFLRYAKDKKNKK